MALSITLFGGLPWPLKAGRDPGGAEAVDWVASAHGPDGHLLVGLVHTAVTWGSAC